MTTLVLLFVLALLDCGFAGFRVAAGRDGRIAKGAYYRAAIGRGVGLGIAWLLLATVALAVALALFPASEDTLASAGGAALWIYGAYATTVLLAFLPYVGGGVELRTLATVALLGPFTMVRLPVIVGGALVGVAAAPGWVTLGAAVYVMLMGVSAEPVLNQWRKARQLP